MSDNSEKSKEILWEDRKRLLFFGLPWTFTKYTLKKDRLFINAGLLKTVEDEIRLYRILDLRLTRTLMQKIFGLGTIHVVSSDKSQGSFDIINIKESPRVKELLSDLVETERDAKRVSTRELVGDDGFDDNDN